MAISLVQHASAMTGGSATVTVTLSSTTAGSCLIMCGLSQVTSGSAFTGVTLGGSAGNWAAQVTDQTAPIGTVAIWADPNCAGGQTSVVVTQSAADLMAVDVYEVSGLALTSPLDKTSQNAIAGTQSTQAWTSNATATTTQASEFWVGITGGYNNLFTAVTVTGPSSPWTNEAQLTPVTGVFSLSGYQITSSTGAATYSGTANTTGTNLFYIAIAATFQPAAAVVAGPGVTARAEPGKTWLRRYRHKQSHPVSAFIPLPAPAYLSAEPGRAVPGLFAPGNPGQPGNALIPGVTPAGAVKIPRRAPQRARTGPAGMAGAGIASSAVTPLGIPVQRSFRHSTGGAW